MRDIRLRRAGFEPAFNRVNGGENAVRAVIVGSYFGGDVGKQLRFVNRRGDFGERRIEFDGFLQCLFSEPRVAADSGLRTQPRRFPNITLTFEQFLICF